MPFDYASLVQGYVNNNNTVKGSTEKLPADIVLSEAVYEAYTPSRKDRKANKSKGKGLFQGSKNTGSQGSFVDHVVNTESMLLIGIGVVLLLIFRR